MSAHTVRISKKAHDELRELSRQYGESMQTVLDYAIEELRRKRFFEQANAAYEELRSEPAAFQEYMAERELWENTLADGLDESESAKETESANSAS